MNKARSFNDPSARLYKSHFLRTSKHFTKATRDYFSEAFSRENPLDNRFKKCSHETSLRSAAIMVRSLRDTTMRTAFTEVFEFCTNVAIDVR